MALDTADRFDGTVGDYVRSRPDYPDALVRWLAEVSGIEAPGPVVDLGAGTGISSRRWAVHGYAVTGVEPNAAMRAAAEAAGGAHYVAGAADATGLPSGSAALVIGCQAFHWFELQPTLAEVERVLRPGGWGMAAWNLRDVAQPQMAAFDALLTAHSSEYRRMPHGPKALAALEAHTDGPTFSLPNGQRLDRAGLRGRAASASYVRRGIADLPAFFAELDVVFDRYAVDGIFDFAYLTRAVAWPR